MRKKKIAVVLSTMPNYGGEHQYEAVLMECLMEMDGKDIELVAICDSRYWRKWCRDNQIHILSCSWPLLTEKEQKRMLRYPLYSKIKSMYWMQLGKTLREEKINAVFVMTQGLFIPNLNIKVIAPVHDLMHRYEGRFPEVSNGYDSRELVFKSKAKYVWCVLTDSIVGKNQFIESYSSYMNNMSCHNKSQTDNIGQTLSHKA